MTLFQRDSILSSCLRGNTDLDVASICNGETRKGKSHCFCMEISCFLPCGMKMHRVGISLIRCIIPQQRPFPSSDDRGSNWSLLEKKNHIVGSPGAAQQMWSWFLGKGCCLALLDSWETIRFGNLKSFLTRFTQFPAKQCRSGCDFRSHQL